MGEYLENGRGIKAKVEPTSIRIARMLTGVKGYYGENCDGWNCCGKGGDGDRGDTVIDEITMWWWRQRELRW